MAVDGAWRRPSEGSGMNASILGPRGPKMPGGVMGGPHGAQIDEEP